MSKVTMSVTRALVELKKLNSQISAAIDSGLYVSVSTGKDELLKLATGLSKEQTNSKIKGSYDKVNSLISNRQKIKAAIVLSNASTKVNVLNTSMTVAEAIEIKSTVQIRQHYLNALQRQLLQARSVVQTETTKLEQIIEQSLAIVYGNDKGKVAEDMYNQVAAPQKKQKEPSLFDPCDVVSKIENLQDEILQLNSEVDFVLSESNAKTVIEVDLTNYV